MEIGTCAVVVHIDLSTYTFGIYNHMCECTFNSVLANSGFFFLHFWQVFLLLKLKHCVV